MAEIEQALSRARRHNQGYSDTEGYTSVYISKYMFDMFRNKDTDVKTQEDLSQVMSKLNCIKIIATDDDPSTPR